jgi:hypothetical protein
MIKEFITVIFCIIVLFSLAGIILATIEIFKELMNTDRNDRR